MQRVIGVLSGKGGVGKTVTSINLSAALHERGYDNTIIDADISSANLTVHLGLPNCNTSLQEVVGGKGDIYKAVRVIPRGLKIVPSSINIDQSVADLSCLKGIIREGLDGMTIVDGPPGFSKEVYHIIESCDEIIVVSNPDIPSITDAVKIIEISKRMGKEVPGIVLTRFENIECDIKPEEISAVCGSPVISIVPEDKQMKRAIFEKTPLVFHSPHSKAAIEYRQLAARLVGEEYRPPSLLSLRRLFNF
jgi:septum site-determining protein MinD